jgi:hypothetical protein
MASRFRELCNELNDTLPPALRAAGYAGPNEEFSRHSVRYEFTRVGPSGIETIAVLFNRNRTPQFGVQLYVAPPGGLDTLAASGGDLMTGALSPCRTVWPFGVRAFGQPSLLSRLLGQSPPSAAQAVQSMLALLPEIDAWWHDQRSTKYIVSSTLTYPSQRRR